MKEYRIPAGHGQAEFVEKRSRFIGQVWPVTTEEEALAHLQATQKQHRDANHNVYAYIIRDTGVIRCSDNGEPQGTAGQPVLHVFEKEEITNILCVVTRYFGGTLLGAGGLVRAYSQGAKVALDAAGISVVRVWRQLLMRCTYAQYERLSKIAVEQGAVIEHSEFGVDITLELLVPEPQGDSFCTHMADVSAGTVELVAIGSREVAVRI